MAEADATTETEASAEEAIDEPSAKPARKRKAKEAATPKLSPPPDR